MTAWSGYQAASWNTISAKSYALVSETAVMAEEKATLAGQQHLYDIITFDSWISAKLGHDEELAGIFERRFRPEYLVAFKAWMALDPMDNPSVPAGPAAMPQYRSALSEESQRLTRLTHQYFEEGVTGAETADRYVRVTVLLATVLLLTALGQRFRIRGPRVLVVTVAFVILILCAWWIAAYPRV